MSPQWYSERAGKCSTRCAQQEPSASRAQQRCLAGPSRRELRPLVGGSPGTPSVGNVVVVAMVVLLCWSSTPMASAKVALGAELQATAQQILQVSGVQGGLVVHLGCGDGRLTAALRASNRYLVHGLDRDPGKVEQARELLDSLGLYGAVSAACRTGRELPYVDNLVNLLVVTEPEWIELGEELARVLSPGGVAMIRGEGTCVPKGLVPAPCDLTGWMKLVKPWPENIDQWTHYLHGPDNNAVAQDTVVGPPGHFQWIAEPRFSRSHDHLASVSVVVSAGGRLFSIVDAGSIAFVAAKPRWRLVARDAFSGVLLWQRDIPRWEYHLRDFRAGPAELARRLVAVDDRVYVTLGYGEPVSCLDAATGETLRTYSGTEGAHEIVCHQGKLFLVLGEPDTNWKAEQAKQIVSQQDYYPPFQRYTPPMQNKQLLVVDAAAGTPLWKRATPDVRHVMPTTLAVDDRRVYFQNTEAIVCLDAATGQEEWKVPRPVQRRRLAWSTPTLVVYDGVVYSADRKAAETSGDLLWLPSGGYHDYLRGDVEGELLALDATTGKRLWSCPAYEGFNAPVDILITDGLLWTGRYAWGQDPGITEARDLKTGQVVRRRPEDQKFMGGIGHARCHRGMATAKYLILGRRGVECVDLKTGEMIAHRYVRGICQYGFVPANGLLYVPPHSCACSVTDLLKAGYLALAPEREQEEPIEPASDAALERGPAFGSPLAKSTADQEAWPTYRHDPSRSGATPAVVPCHVRTAWAAPIGGRLTSPVVAENVLLVAETGAHRVHALDASTGRRRWSFVAGARIDSPPTIDQGRALFGSADGCVYCLRLTDGALIWRFRAAPRDRRIVVDEQLESTWPVSGSVLVLDGAAYFAAGRTSYLDGGMFLYKLDAATGRMLKAVKLDTPKEKRDRGVTSGGYLPDVLSALDQSIFMRNSRFDRDLVRQKDDVAHIWSPVGFLDHNWWHRTYWQFGTSMESGWGNWPKAGQRVPAGRLLVTDGKRILGYGRNQYDTPGAHVGVDAEGVWGPIGQSLGRWTFYRLFAATLQGPQDPPARSATRPPAEPYRADWSQRIPLLVQGMVLAGDTLFLAGPEDPLDHVPQEPSEVDALAEALEATAGGRLMALAPADGKTLAEHRLESPPVFDGLVATPGRLYLSTKAGQVVCLAAQ